MNKHEYEKILTKSLNKNTYCISSDISGDISGTITWGCFGCNKKDKTDFIPVRIIYNKPYTICYFSDDTKTISKCGEGEEYIKENGVMACIIKKIFESRGKFLRLVKNGYEQLPKK